MTTISTDDVRGALGKNQSEVSDSELEFDKELAEDIVTDELDPYSDNTDALEDTAALLAGAFYKSGGGVIRQLSQGSRQLSFNEKGALGLWRKGVMRDPTDRLKNLEEKDDFWSVTL
jgi:hypothetical protein